MTLKNRRIFAAIGVVLLLIIITGLAEPIITNNAKEEWEINIQKEVDEIEEAVGNYVNQEIDNLLNKNIALQKYLLKISSQPNSISNLIKFINSDEYNNLNIQIYENDTNLVAWNGITFGSNYNKTAGLYETGEIFLYSDKILSFIAVEDTLTAESIYRLIIAKPIEKHYKLNNKYFDQISISEKFSNQFSIKFKVYFNPAEKYTKDGRFTSIDIRNNLGNKIGLITFQKPTLTNHIQSISNTASSIQAALFLIGYILLWFTIYLNIKQINHRLIRLSIYILYIALFRIFLFVFDLPNKILSGGLTDPEYFSSTFGYGIAGSPIDFFITAIMLLIICLIIYKYSIEYFPSERFNDRKNAAALITVLILIFLLFLRGFGAALNSVVFDSTLRYFRDVSLIPNTPIFLMEINILILGICSVIISIAIIQLCLKIAKRAVERRIVLIFLVLFIIFQFAGVLFDLIQKQPQGTPFIRILYITSIFLFSYYVYFNSKVFLNFIYIAFIGSILSISLLNYYNSELQRESLKTTAVKLTRPGEPYINNLISEMFKKWRVSETTKNIFTDDADNYTAEAFKLWVSSDLYKEGVSSEINFLDSNKNYLGGYGFNFDSYYRADWSKFSIPNESVSIFSESLLFSDSKIIRSIAQIRDKDNLIGYLEISVLYDVDIFEFRESPVFLSGNNDIVNPEVELEDLAVFDFHDGELINELSDFTLSDEEKQLLTSVNFSDQDEAWLTIPLKGEMHRVYLIKNNQLNFERILAVALKEREVSWNLYDFFKVFFIHSLTILGVLILFVMWGVGERRIIKLTFRTRLLLAFILVSIVPLILLASYFRLLTEEKNTTAKEYKLGKRAFNVESYINDYIANSTINSVEIFNKANRDLGIDFSIFEGKKLVFSTVNKYYQVGLLSETLNPIAYNRLVILGAKEYVAEENIEGYKFSSFYYRGIIGSEEYIYKVSGVFNPIMLPLSDIEINIFLFGSYSLAIILIVILSTILANQIASPIRKLTNATKSVASGDLNIELYTNSRGEIGQLVNGFNLMVRELKKSQAELAEIERETAWKEFARQVAHEIKNPLTPMKLSVQQLSAAHKDNSPKFNSIFEKVTQTLISQIETLKNIATEFSSFARMPKINVEKIDLTAALNNAVNLFAEENVKIKIEGVFSNPKVVADIDQTTRTIINLIRNSIQAGADSVKCLLLENEKFNIIKIDDNGHGIPQEIAEKVFENNFTTKKEGMGIGLSLAKKYLENINGTIEIEKTSEAGTVIIISFPKAIE
ncbi:MAG: HAMP domain-containing protein [Ignavibacteriae bacterium]|nr:HAMP domain-containing protein [Ignavibacteriota bacterium]NOG97497.1 HAMP domain-containing protein [Ignavibacteriota bacterium]